MKSFDEKLQNGQVVGITGHVRPDGDCAGSTLAVYNYIKNNYPDSTVHLFLEPIPNIFRFLQRSDEIDSDYEVTMDFDVVITLDCGDLNRIGKAAPYFEKAKHTICVDHHASNQAFADDNYVFPDASATCELVYELMDESRITREIAECLYTGMVHDTGVFQYSCTSAKTMNIAGKLMEMGIDYPKIVDDTFYTKTFHQNQVLGQALLNSRLYEDGKIIASVITLEEMRKYDVLPKHLDGIVNQLRVTKDVLVAIFLYENEDHTFKGSLRVNGDFDVARVAMAFGGGGHVKAAGFGIDGPEDVAMERILAEIRKYL